MQYAAFIITFKRPEILNNTINMLFSQTVPPKKVLIVDNDPDNSAKEALIYFSESFIDYYPVGLNAGPAGGAYWGLKKLFEEGWEWVLWVDDDDPPSANNQIETIFKLPSLYTNPEKIGIIGASGVLFNYNKCTISRIADKKLTGILNIDMIAGNQFPIVNKRVYDVGLLPDPNLFFGFEDLEFNLRVKKYGFDLLVLGEEVIRLRQKFNKLDKVKKRGLKKNINHLWREYYSVRTITYLLLNNNSYIILSRFVFWSIIRSLSGIRFGFKYGIYNAKFIIKGIVDGLRKKMGIRVLPEKKY